MMNTLNQPSTQLASNIGNEVSTSLLDPNINVTVNPLLNQFLQISDNMMNTLNQIWKWVMKPEVWTFIGCASAVVGLVCYALSSSFNHLFGNWNLLKKILYSLFSFIISLIMLFAYKWTHSISPWFKVIANIAKALVITLGALYSFYLEKKVEGKPDAYSLMSYAAFTIMSLSLLLQSRGRFGKELMEFFVACLIVEFMKIKPIFFILGACFYYSILAVFFSQIEAESHSNINVTANQPSTELGSNIGNEVSTSLLDSNIIVTVDPRSTQLASTIDNEDSTSLLDPNINVTVDPHSPQLASTNSGSIILDCEKAVKALRQENPTLIEMLIEKLKDYLSGDSRFSGFNVSEYTDLMIMALPTKTMDNIQRIADLMVRSGFTTEFSDVYSSSRSECLIESLSRLGFKKLNIEDLQMLSWKEILDETERWIKATNVALKILFPAERKLCNRFYFGFSSTADLLFMDVCRESTQQLLNFAEAIAIGSRSPERLPTVIKVIDTMRDLIIPEFKYLFCDQYIGSLQNEITTIYRRLGEAPIGILLESVNMIKQSPTGRLTFRGVPHSVTSYEDYLSTASRSWETLEQVFEVDNEEPLKEYLKIEDRFSYDLMQDIMDHIMEVSVIKERWISSANRSSYSNHLREIMDHITVWLSKRGKPEKVAKRAEPIGPTRLIRHFRRTDPKY